VLERLRIAIIHALAHLHGGEDEAVVGDGLRVRDDLHARHVDAVAESFVHERGAGLGGHWQLHLSSRFFLSSIPAATSVGTLVRPRHVGHTPERSHVGHGTSVGSSWPGFVSTTGCFGFVGVARGP
jgi:hypothetical protein